MKSSQQLECQHVKSGKCDECLYMFNTWKKVDYDKKMGIVKPIIEDN